MMSSKLHKIVDTNKRCKHINDESLSIFGEKFGEKFKPLNNDASKCARLETFKTKRNENTIQSNRILKRMEQIRNNLCS